MKQVIIVRKDLNMRKGKMIAQGAHASIIAILNNGVLSGTDNKFSLNDLSHTTANWLAGIQTKIVVGCDSEEELLNLYKQAKEAKLLCSLVKDIGKTEFKEPTYTAVAIGPDTSKKINNITDKLKLL